MTPKTFHEHTNSVLPRFAPDKTISLVTAYRWMYKLGFRPHQYCKSIYYDGHDRPDVVEYRKTFIEEVAQLRSQSVTYCGDELEDSIVPEVVSLGHKKQTVFIYHDESTIHANER